MEACFPIVAGIVTALEYTRPVFRAPLASESGNISLSQAPHNLS